MIRYLAILSIFVGTAAAADSQITVSYRFTTGRSVKLEFKQTPPDPAPKIVHLFLLGPSGKREITAGLAATTPNTVGKSISYDVTENDTTAPTDETRVEVVLQNPDTDLTGPIVFPADAKKTLANIQSTLNDKVSSAKSSDEKNLFAGVAVTVPSGSDAQGSGDFVFNKQFWAYQVHNGALFDSANVGLTLKKSSAKLSDPRHFSAGLDLRKTFLFHGKEFDNVKKAIQSNNPDNAQGELAKLQSHFWPTLFFDNGVSFEGDVRAVSLGNVSNFVFNSQLKLASATAQFSRAGYFFLRIIPAGIEAGYNLQNADAPALDGKSLARYKSGGTMTFRYDSNNNAALNRIDLELNAVDRYLFQRELTLNSATNLVTLLDKGNKYYAEGNMKFYFLKLGKGRPGFRVTFKRGFLPPAFAFTKAFDAGFFYESADDKTSSK